MIAAAKKGGKAAKEYCEKNNIKIDENKLFNIIKESVIHILKEGENKRMSASRMMDKANPTNRAKFREEDMANDWKAFDKEVYQNKTPGMQRADDDFKALPKEMQDFYKSHPDIYQEALRSYYEEELRDMDMKYGNYNNLEI